MSENPIPRPRTIGETYAHAIVHATSPSLVFYRRIAVGSTLFLVFLMGAIGFAFMYQGSEVNDPIEPVNEKASYARRIGDEALILYREFRITRKTTLTTTRTLIGTHSGVISERPVELQERISLGTTVNVWEPHPQGMPYGVRARLPIPVDLPKGYNYVLHSTACWNLFLRVKCLAMPPIPFFNDTEVDK